MLRLVALPESYEHNGYDKGRTDKDAITRCSKGNFKAKPQNCEPLFSTIQHLDLSKTARR